MAFGYEVAIGREAESAVERGVGTISGKAAVARGSTAVRRFYAREGSIECIQYFFNGDRPEFSPLLSESGRSRSIRVKAKEIEQFDPCGGSPLRNKQTDQRVRWQFAGSGEIYSRMERTVFDVSRNIVDGGEEEMFNQLWCNHVRDLLK